MWHICRSTLQGFGGETEGKRTDGIPRLNCKELKWNVSRMCVGWMNVVQDGGKWQGVVKTGLNFKK